MLSKTDIQKEIYEGREKARRDERARFQGALEQGIQRGRLMGRIETLRSLLGSDSGSYTDLESMSLEDLQRTADELRQRLGR